MVIEEGSFVVRYVYDESGKRLSAEFDYADGTARGAQNANGEYGENPASDIAVNGIGKVWYRTSLLNSTLYVVNVDGETVAHMIYDAWGKPLIETYADANFSGLENLNNFTGYTWDETLGLYFAQNRFYDPSTHRFTQEDIIKDGSNWYVYCGNSPIVWTDPLGLEKIVISGGVTSEDFSTRGRYELFKYQFIETALCDIRNKVFLQIQAQVDSFNTVELEEITWIVINYGYSKEDKKKFTEAADHWGVNLVIVEEKKDLINYINTKNTNGFYCSKDRAADPITTVSVYSHGLAGYLGFGYNSDRSADHERGELLNLYINDLKQLNKDAFKNTYSVFYSCNTGTNDSTGTSFAQQWANLTNGTARAVVNGRTDYENINVVPIWNVAGIMNKIIARDSRSENGFSIIGSVNVPTASKGVKWKNFTPQQ